MSTLGRLGLLLVLAACKPPTAPTEVDAVVAFQGRRIDLAPHLAGYPYRSFFPDWDAGRVYYTSDGAGGTSLRFVPWRAEGASDPAVGLPMTTIDWSTRSMWGLIGHPSGDLFFLGDESNDERINLYRLATGDQTVRALTDEAYLYGASLSPDHDRWAVLPRRGDGPYTSCLETMALDGSDRQVVVCDTPDAPLTWSEPVWAPDGRGVLLNVDLDGRRDRGNLAWVPFDAPSLQIVTDPAVERTTAWAVGFVDDHRALIVTTEGGEPTLSRVDLATGAREVLRTFDRDIDTLRLLDDGGPLLVQLDDPQGDLLQLLDRATGDPIGGWVELPGSARVLGEPHGREALVQVTSAATPRVVYRVVADDDGGLSVQPWMAPPPAVADRLVHCDVELVSYATHDVDPTTGEPRVLDALLYTPRKPASPPTARILAFYGGANRFDTETQVFCEAGIATLSPAVRGTWGRGEAFARLNDGDLGGDEIADLFGAAALLEARGYPRGRIGVYGRSHGGYATMRALTFPPGTNGHDEVYPFAFGISDAGFSDIVTFWETCNIPDWVILEAGDPETEADRLRDRSPLHHVDLLDAPLLLVHGANDSRVPVRESRQFAEACAAAGKPCTYLEVADQGHRVNGVVNETAVYRAKLDFLAEHLFD